MGVLGHSFEREGLPTTQISLIREHTERLRPPRALFVPFDFGRPFGAPRDAAFQTRVLRAALELLEAGAGPVLADFPEDAPGSGAAEDAEGFSCPIPLPPRAPATGTAAAFAEELERLLPWYELARERTGRTTVGLSGLTPKQLADFLPRLLGDALPPSPIEGTPLSLAVKHAAEDLRALYTEAATAQPGGRPVGARAAADWFWNATRAGELLRALQARLARCDDSGLKLVARLMLVPFDQGGGPPRGRAGAR